MENENTSKHTTLLLEAESEEVRAVVFSTGNKSSSEYIEFTGSFNSGLLGTHKLFRQVYKEVWFSLQTDRFTLVPEAFFQKDKTAEIAAAAFSYFPEKEDLLVSVLKELQLVSISTIEKELMHQLRQKFPQAVICHSSHAFLSSVFEPEQPLTLHLQHSGSILEFAIMEKESLLFYNQFLVHTPEDAVYHLLNVCKVLKLEQQTIQLRFYFGDAYPELKKWLDKFFPKVVCIGENTVGLKHPTQSLFSLDKCE